MALELRRKLYKRGSSFETTIPKPLLFALDLTQPQYVVFSYDPSLNKWFVKFQKRESKITSPGVNP